MSVLNLTRKFSKFLIVCVFSFALSTRSMLRAQSGAEENHIFFLSDYYCCCVLFPFYSSACLVVYALNMFASNLRVVFSYSFCVRMVKDQHVKMSTGIDEYLFDACINRHNFEIHTSLSLL